MSMAINSGNSKHQVCDTLTISKRTESQNQTCSGLPSAIKLQAEVSQKNILW